MTVLQTAPPAPIAPLTAGAPGSVRDAIAARFATLIATGVLEVGECLPAERALAQTMGVCRETIRGALMILSERGIVAVTQGARTRVISADVGALGLTGMSHLQTSDYGLDDIHEARLTVEAQIAALAAKRVTPPLLAELDALLETQQAAPNDPLRFLITDRAFHTAVYRACGNAVLADLATTLYAYQLNHRRTAVARPGAIARSIADHRVILDALHRRDPAALGAAMGVHERRIYDSTRALLAATAPKDRA